VNVLLTFYFVLTHVLGVCEQHASGDRVCGVVAAGKVPLLLWSPWCSETWILCVRGVAVGGGTHVLVSCVKVYCVCVRCESVLCVYVCVFVPLSCTALWMQSLADSSSDGLSQSSRV
jgi:hypothetical protein